MQFNNLDRPRYRNGSALPESFSVIVHQRYQRVCLRRSTGRSGETSQSSYRRAYSYTTPWSLAQNPTSGAHSWCSCPNSPPTLVPTPLHTALPRLCRRYSSRRSGETNLSAYHRACSHTSMEPRMPPQACQTHGAHALTGTPLSRQKRVTGKS